MLKILYEDNHIIAVTKPCNVPVMKDASNDLDLQTMVKLYIKEKYNKPGNVFIGLVHRLDRPVGGAIVLARTSKGASRLSEQIRSQKMSKTYLCIVRGTMVKKKGTLINYLVKNQQINKSSIANSSNSHKKKAILDYEVLSEKSGLSLVKVKLQTGRHHQIRVQLSHLGYPIYGDLKYGTIKQKAQIALWAHEIVFEHPTKKEEIKITSSPNYEIFPWSLFI